MIPTNEQITVEALRRRKERGQEGLFLADFIIEVVRENWTPPEPEPVDPDVLAWREWFADRLGHSNRTDVIAGHWDTTSHAIAFLAGARMAREQERERANHPIAFAVRVMAGVFKDLDHAKREARAVLAKYRGEA